MGSERDTHRDPQRDDAHEAHKGSTSPPGGKTYEATKPPKPGDLDESALEKSREGLDLAAGAD